ncbi:hypothetical protein GCM10022225_78090 [Plantactinospora mayteni]|uniref:Uncharacterized protein n=1 Tax=Plantactinospora mayteni TaxID=566021 RepID=A0ABQ4ERG9_9ACTN|nr:hypothetical protein Pma05_38240 [Plantactinospora mayteni]
MGQPQAGLARANITSGPEIARPMGCTYLRLSIGTDLHGEHHGGVTPALSNRVTCVREKKQPFITLPSSCDVVAVLDALHRSLGSGPPETLR